MKPSNLFNSDDRAVSPVIGVILMVAITVILAAVIGTFVLGLGDSLGDSQPTAQLSADLDESADEFTIEHSGGDSIESDSLRVIVSADGLTNDAEGTISQRLSVGDTVTAELNQSAGSEVTIGSETDVRIRIIHQPSDSIILDRTVETTTGNLEITDNTDDSITFA
jgi:flagellin-like protein